MICLILSSIKDVKLIWVCLSLSLQSNALLLSLCTRGITHPKQSQSGLRHLGFQISWFLFVDLSTRMKKGTAGGLVLSWGADVTHGDATGLQFRPWSLEVLFHALLSAALASGRPLTPGTYGAQGKLRWPPCLKVLGS